MLWLGTWDGLNRYDGSEFRVYKFQPDNPNTISNNVIRRIVEESYGILWVATDYGINRIDVRNDRIERFYPGYEASSPVGGALLFRGGVARRRALLLVAGVGHRPLRRQPGGQFAALNVPQVNTSAVRMLRLLLRDGCCCSPHRAICSRCAAPLRHRRARGGRDGAAAFGAAGRGALRYAAADLHRHGGVPSSGSTTTPRASSRSSSCACRFRLPPRSGSAPLPKPLRDASSAPLRAPTPASSTPRRGPFRRSGSLPAFRCSRCWRLAGDSLGGQRRSGVLSLYEDDLEFNRTDNRQLFDGKSAPVRAFYEDARGNLYIATKGNGIRVLRPDGHAGGSYDRSERPGQRLGLRPWPRAATTICSSATTARGSTSCRSPRGASRRSIRCRGAASVRSTPSCATR